MRIRIISFTAMLTMLCMLAGCGQQTAGPAATDVVPAAEPPVVAGTDAPATPTTDRWLGQWQGPEGTWLRLAGGNGTYEITIQNLDGPRSFPGSGVGDEIRFERDGIEETLHATDGVGTGMKWLSEKTDCVTVRLGEGYCRD